MLRDGFSTREVLQLTGTTARQLQWWDEKHIIVPVRHGRRRLYSAADLMEIHVIAELRRKRISLPAVRRVLKFLRRETSAQFPRLVSGDDEYHLLLDGNNLYLESDTRQIVNLIGHTTHPVFVICLSDAARRVEVSIPEQKKLSVQRSAAATDNKKPPARTRIQQKEESERAG